MMRLMRRGSKVMLLRDAGTSLHTRNHQSHDLFRAAEGLALDDIGAENVEAEALAAKDRVERGAREPQ